MIPQIQERITKLEAALSESEREIQNLRENVSQLREQLQIERPPSCVPPIGIGYDNAQACKPSARY